MCTGIVYCLSRKDSEQVCLELCGKGINAGCYHADVPPGERSRVHRQWLSRNVQVQRFLCIGLLRSGSEKWSRYNNYDIVVMCIKILIFGQKSSIYSV